VSDQADVPTLVRTQDGCLWTWFVTYAEPQRNQTVAAVSEDGLDWYLRELTLDFAPPRVADPSVVALDAGRRRMYFSATFGLPLVSTFSATSSDGIGWVLDDEEARVSDPDEPIIAPAVFTANGTTTLFSIAHAGRNLFATSSNALDFTRHDDFVVSGDRPWWVSNGVATDDGARAFLFTLPPLDDPAQGFPIRSAVSWDQAEWTVEDGERLSVESDNPDEAVGVRDAAVTRLADGSWLMVYVSQIP